jgi:hypothetical protein
VIIRSRSAGTSPFFLKKKQKNKNNDERWKPPMAQHTALTIDWFAL